MTADSATWRRGKGGRYKPATHSPNNDTAASCGANSSGVKHICYIESPHQAIRHKSQSNSSGFEEGRANREGRAERANMMEEQGQEENMAIEVAASRYSSQQSWGSSEKGDGVKQGSAYPRRISGRGVPLKSGIHIFRS